MKYKWVMVLFLIVLIPLVGCAIAKNGQNASAEGQQKERNELSEEDWRSIAANSTYKIDDYNQYATLVDGRFDAVGQSRLHVTLYKTPKPVVGNLRIGNESVNAVALLLSVNGGGSGIFMCVAACYVDNEGQYVGTNAISLGDRLNPQSIRIVNGNIVVEYLGRHQWEALAAKQTVPKTRIFAVRENVLVETDH